jgi:hypothetical protein
LVDPTGYDYGDEDDYRDEDGQGDGYTGNGPGGFIGWFMENIVGAVWNYQGWWEIPQLTEKESDKIMNEELLASHEDTFTEGGRDFTDINSESSNEKDHIRIPDILNQNHTINTDKYSALEDENGRIRTPFFIKDEKLAMDIIWRGSFTPDGKIRCETLMFKVFEGFIIMPNNQNDESHGKTYFGVSWNYNRLINLNGQTYYLDALIHVHPDPTSIKISDYDIFYNKILPVFIIFKGDLFDINGQFIKKVVK